MPWNKTRWTTGRQSVWQNQGHSVKLQKKIKSKRKAMWYCSQNGDVEEKEKEAGSVSSPTKAPEGSWPNGNEPQGLLCFTGCSSACENLWNKATLNYLSQCPHSPGSLHVTTELGGPNSGCYKPCMSLSGLSGSPASLDTGSGGSDDSASECLTTCGSGDLCSVSH